MNKKIFLFLMFSFVSILSVSAQPPTGGAGSAALLLLKDGIPSKKNRLENLRRESPSFFIEDVMPPVDRKKSKYDFVLQQANARARSGSGFSDGSAP